MLNKSTGYLLHRAEGSSFGYARTGSLDGVIAILLQLVRFLGARFSSGALVSSGLWALVCRRLLTLSGATDVSAAGLVHALQLVLLVVSNVATDTDGIKGTLPNSNARAAIVAAHDLPSILSSMLQHQYLDRLSTWPAQYGGGSEMQSRVVSLVSRILFLPFETSNPSADSAPAEVHSSDLAAIQSSLLAASTVPALVHVLLQLSAAALERAIVLLSRLIMLPGAHFAKQYLDSAGLAPAVVKRLIDKNNRPGLILDSLIIFSMLARLSRDFYPALHQAAAYGELVLLLSPTNADASIRARVCNLVGNMSRYSDYFYEALELHGLVAAVIRCAEDEDANTRKFACFALGNAAFHSAALYESLRAAITPLIACLKEPLEKTRSNAAGALGNLVRNSDLLATTLTELGAVEALMQASDAAGGVDSSSKVALYSLGTVASYECCQQVILQSGFLPRLQELAQSRDRTVAKYAARVSQRITPP